VKIKIINTKMVNEVENDDVIYRHLTKMREYYMGNVNFFKDLSEEDKYEFCINSLHFYVKNPIMSSIKRFKDIR
jgi:hypothetical protein